MIITNKNNLPQVLIDSIEENHIPVEKHYSVTTLLNPIREILLIRRHYNEIKQDISDMVWLIFGSAVHKLIEDADKTGFAEYKLENLVIDDYYLTGICDLYDEANFTIVDWKTASVWKIIHKDFESWRKQGLMYAWLLRKRGYHTKKLKFHAFLKDWSSVDAKYKADYPKYPIYVWEYEVTEGDMLEIQSFIETQFKLIIACEKLKDDELPICSPEERYNSGDKYAVMKHGRKSAIRVCDSKEEASALITSSDMYIEVRLGEDRKCNDYCICKEFCSYWKSKNKEE
jgi:hypothetical protein